MDKKLYTGNLTITIRDLVSQLKIANELDRYGEFITDFFLEIKDEIGFDALEESMFYLSRIIFEVK